jgi:DNA-binding NarL/FixJ family response regulator
MGIFDRKVMVVDDDSLLLGLIGAKLETDGFDPDIAVLDIELGDGPTGIDLAHVLRKTNPEIVLVFLTHIPEPRIVGLDNRAIPKNAAYLVKDRLADPGMLVQAIEAAVRDRVNNGFRDDKNVDHKLSDASRSQLAVLQMIALGMSNQQIAKERGTTIRAVENLVKRAFESAGVDVENDANPRVTAAREYIKLAGMPYGK